MNNRVVQQFGNYRLIRLLGRGAFAEVYLGEHIYLQTQAAIKVLQMQLVSNALEKFLAEACTIARLKHPSIVGLLEFGVEGKTPFLVMEYAPNGSLRQCHPKGTRLPATDIVPYVKQITAGLQYAHDEKLIHRDIKPENLLLGANHEVLLTDFGLAEIARTNEQSTHEVAGTPAYMAPEQLLGKPRRASDQYALGVIVYEWLTGSLPFSGSFVEVAHQHLHATPPSLRSMVPEIPSAVEYVVMTALAKDPQQRFASVQAFARALEQACRSEPYPFVISLPHPPMVLSSSAVQTKEATQLLLEHNLQPSHETIPQPLPVQPQHRRSPVWFVLLFTALVLLILGGISLPFYMSITQPEQQQLYERVTSGRPALDSPLNQNDSFWEWVEPQTGDCSFRESAYHSTVLQKGRPSFCLAQATYESNFAYQVQMTIVRGDAGGLIFRSDGTAANNYLFSISRDGRYNLSYQSNQSITPLLLHKSSKEIKTGLGQPNVLTVMAQDSNISLYINGHHIVDVSDNKFSAGSFGVFALSNGNPTEVEFSNAKVWNLK